jgi:hypothetical protein
MVCKEKHNTDKKNLDKSQEMDKKKERIKNSFGQTSDD